MDLSKVTERSPFLRILCRKTRRTEIVRIESREIMRDGGPVHPVVRLLVLLRVLLLVLLVARLSALLQITVVL